MKKVLGHFGLISDVLVSKSYGLLGKNRSSFFTSFDQDLSPDALECLKDAAVYDSRAKIAHRSQDLFPSRNGILRESPPHKKKLAKKRKSSALTEASGESAITKGEEHTLLSPLLKSLDNKVSTSSIPEIDVTTNSIAEVDEKVRSIKAQRLADAMNHPSFDKLEQEQKDLIKHEWISSLLGLEEK